MNEELWQETNKRLHDYVDKFMAKQRVSMTESPDDFVEVTSEDFVVFFYEWDGE